MTRRKTTLAFLLVVAGCGAFDGDDGAPPPAPSQDGEAPPPPPPVGETPGQDKITDEFGVFVAQPGAPDADGTQAKPFGTIAPAIEKARATSKLVYVCSGTFKESVTIARGIALIGGLDCSTPTWKLGGARTRIESPTSPALRAEQINYLTRVEGFDFVAPDGTPENPTSIGFLAKAAEVTIAKSSITAGKGHDGAAGTDGVQMTFSYTTAPGAGHGEWMSGGPPYRLEPDNVGGVGGVGSCAGAPNITVGAGGAGGIAGDYTSGYCCGQFCFCPSYPWENKRTVCVTEPLPLCRNEAKSPAPGVAGTGAAATPGNDGTSANTLGSFTPNGFQPASGTQGAGGTGGKGGKGGDGGSDPDTSAGMKDRLAQGATGPGGGAGGCPGLPGTPGKGGGASVAVLASASPALTFDTVEILAGKGGAGGKGNFGSNPTHGGRAADAYAGAGAGSPGEAGGRSGVSGSGAGGSSVGIAYTGGEPARKNTTIKAGEQGAGVPEEVKDDAVGNKKKLPASASGEAKELLAF